MISLLRICTNLPRMRTYSKDSMFLSLPVAPYEGQSAYVR
jgi:hypothetical protein